MPAIFALSPRPNCGEYTRSTQHKEGYYKLDKLIWTSLEYIGYGK